MEKSENKSIIYIGGSKLAKTEKLLSITQKILSEIKPQFDSVRIGNQEWMTRNLDVDRFRNGDLIPQIDSNVEWEKAGQNKQPAWCYYNNDPENGKKYGKLYNWFVVNDPRGLAPLGWHIPTDEEWTCLVEFLGKDAGYKMRSVEGWNDWKDKYGQIRNGNGANLSEFNGLPGGYRFLNGSFTNIRSYFAFFWSSTESNINSAWNCFLYFSSGSVSRFRTSYKSVGASVRCLRD